MVAITRLRVMKDVNRNNYWKILYSRELELLPRGARRVKVRGWYRPVDFTPKYSIRCTKHTALKTTIEKTLKEVTFRMKRENNYYFIIIHYY